ncbi:MAG: hypothetical protein K8F25_17005 [Fimbriimonadaceae bacterium]|nr:hypothetical protein [Alphaproteobacteria bacterium]
MQVCNFAPLVKRLSFVGMSGKEKMANNDGAGPFAAAPIRDSGALR